MITVLLAALVVIWVTPPIVFALLVARDCARRLDKNAEMAQLEALWELPCAEVHR
jgi:ABC-type enterobactin transport system permease subunit